jgi:hypothetical protein
MFIAVSTPPFFYLLFKIVKILDFVLLSTFFTNLDIPKKNTSI